MSKQPKALSLKDKIEELVHRPRPEGSKPVEETDPVKKAARARALHIRNNWHPEAILTPQQAQMLLTITKEKQDVTNREFALAIRKMQATLPDTERYFVVYRSFTPATETGDAPFFAITLKPEGKRIAEKYKNPHQLDNMSGTTP